MSIYNNVLLASVLPHLNTPELFTFRLTSLFAKESCLSEEVWDRAAMNFTKYPTMNDQYVKLFQKEAWYDTGANDRYKQIVSRPDNNRTMQEQRFVHFWDGIYHLRRNTDATLREYYYEVFKSDTRIDMESVMFHLYYDLRSSDLSSIIWIKSTVMGDFRADQPKTIWYGDIEQEIWPLQVSDSGVFMVTGPYDKVILKFEVIGDISDYHGGYYKQHVITGCLTFENLSEFLEQYFAEAIEFYAKQKITVGSDEDMNDVISGYVSFIIEEMNGEEIFEAIASDI
jgi:hypothetical protein